MGGKTFLQALALVDAETGRILGAEALVRWLHPTRGLLMPGEFIDLAEQTGLIVPIGDQVLRVALNDLASWRKKGFDQLRMHVNASVKQLVGKQFLTHFQNAVDVTGVPTTVLSIEVTESVLIEDATKAEPLFVALKQTGITISLDDFGTGYSSLAYLKRFPVDKIKIDRSFVCDIPGDASDCAVVEATLAISERLDRETIAEGVENRDQAAWLLERGCRVMQGFYFSPPVAADAFLVLLSSGPLSANHSNREEEIRE